MNKTRLYYEKNTENGIKCNKTPTVVHCSAGLGRAGVYSTLVGAFGIIDMHKKGLLGEEKVPKSVTDLVKMLRTKRPGLVQTRGQLLFIYKCVGKKLKDVENESSEKEKTDHVVTQN